MSLVRQIAFLGCLATAASFFFPTQALAGNSRKEQKAADHYIEQAQFSFNVGRWDDALANYEAAYAITKDPSLLVLIGDTCARKGDKQRAIDCYQNYLNTEPNASAKETIERRIQELKEQTKEPPPAAPAAAPDTPAPVIPVPMPPTGVGGAAATAMPGVAGTIGAAAETAPDSSVATSPPTSAAAPPPVPTPTDTVRVEQAPAAQAPVAKEPVVSRLPRKQVSPQSPDDSSTTADVSTRSDEHVGAGRRVLGVVLMATGAALVGVGGYFSWRTHNLESSISDSSEFDAGKYRDGQTAEKWQWVSYGVGAGAVVCGLITYFTGRSSSSQVSLAPQIGPGLAGLGAQGTF